MPGRSLPAPTHPADELAEIRGAIGRLRLREAMLKKRLLAAGPGGRTGSRYAVFIEAEERLEVIEDRLPPWVRADPALFRRRQSRVYRLEPLGSLEEFVMDDAPAKHRAPAVSGGADATLAAPQLLSRGRALEAAAEGDVRAGPVAATGGWIEAPMPTSATAAAGDEAPLPPFSTDAVAPGDPANDPAPLVFLSRARPATAPAAEAGGL